MYFVLTVQYFQTEPYPKTSTVQFCRIHRMVDYI